MQLEAYLGKDIARKGKVGVNSKGGLVLDLIAARASIAVVSFRFRYYRDILVVLLEEGSTLISEQGGV